MRFFLIILILLSGNHSFFISDVTGRKIFSGRFTETEYIIDLNEAASGIYFLKVSGIRSLSFKLIVSCFSNF
ncbi:MAG: T9SS type A sorting domain-containing protein [Bacteroidia bacterium]|nr:T9SS type A sorting domain-containing protein [Bacteroidia bacterium]